MNGTFPGFNSSCTWSLSGDSAGALLCRSPLVGCKCRTADTESLLIAHLQILPGMHHPGGFGSILFSPLKLGCRSMVLSSKLYPHHLLCLRLWLARYESAKICTLLAFARLAGLVLIRVVFTSASAMMVLLFVDIILELCGHCVYKMASGRILPRMRGLRKKVRAASYQNIYMLILFQGN